VAAGREIARMVRRFVVIKKGEHGSLLIAGPHVCALPAFPTVKVVDPTGAGDSFAGAMMGHLAAENHTDIPTIRRAIAYGTVTASFTLEGFSLNKLRATAREDIEARMREFRDLTAF